MDISIQFNVTTASEQEIIVVGAFQKKTTKGKKEEIQRVVEVVSEAVENHLNPKN